jgi:methionyl-tRNA formyltransferase
MTKSSKIVFFGNERLSSGFDPQGAPTLELLIARGYDVVAVVANFEPGRSRNARGLEISTIAEQHSIPLLLPQKLADIREQLLQLQPDVGVLVAYGKIIPQSIIDVFPHGIVNIHPSLLPQYRGSTPIEQAILDGADKTGVSLMQIVRQMDAGPVFAQNIIQLTGHETKQNLTRVLLLRGGEMLAEALPRIIDGSLTGTPQDESKATYTRLFTKQDSQLDFTKPSTQLEREVRALAGWPKSRATIFGHDVVVLGARVANNQADGALVLTCARNTYLEVTSLTAPSGRTMSGADFVRGYKK